MSGGLTKAGLPWVVIILFFVGCAGRRPTHYGVMKPKERVQGLYHKVEAGQTLWRICKAYGVDLQQVAEINNIQDVTNIRVGQRLFIPGAARPLKVAPYRPPEGGVEEPEPEPKVATFQGRFDWPTHGPLTSTFGVRNGIIHSGIDIAAPAGTPVVASAAGEVAYRGKLRGYGNLLILKHSSMYTTVYAHLKSAKALENQWVAQGEVIGTVGDSGESTGSHLHFEIRVRNKARNPLFYLPKTPEQK
jgi:murein DD-endopeptidase MepM/ murein hydrolase activator NlpD